MRFTNQRERGSNSRKVKLSNVFSSVARDFERKEIGDIRIISLCGMTGKPDDVKDCYMRVEYVKDGDYTESDKSPLYCRYDADFGLDWIR